MIQERQPDRFNRREMLKWLGGRGIETGAFFVGINIASAIKDNSRNPQLKAAQDQANQAIESGQGLQVKDFAGEIIATSGAIVDYSGGQNVAELLVGFFGGNTLIAYILKNQSTLINRVVSSVSVVPARLIDSLSTIAAAKYIQDPRFQEYGFGDYISDQNPLTPNNISFEDILKLNVISDPLLSAVSWIAIPFGRGYLGASPLLAKNNFQIASLVGKSLDLGDRIKTLIRDGKTSQDVNSFLQQELSGAKENSQETTLKAA